jgi:hypothetical protein
LKYQVLTEEKLDKIGARLEHSPQKSLTHLEQEKGVSKSSAQKCLGTEILVAVCGQHKPLTSTCVTFIYKEL